MKVFHAFREQITYTVVTNKKFNQKSITNSFSTNAQNKLHWWPWVYRYVQASVNTVHLQSQWLK